MKKRKKKNGRRVMAIFMSLLMVFSIIGSFAGYLVPQSRVLEGEELQEFINETNGEEGAVDVDKSSGAEIEVEQAVDEPIAEDTNTDAEVNVSVPVENETVSENTSEVQSIVPSIPDNTVESSVIPPADVPVSEEGNVVPAEDIAE